jgi:type II secretory pathway component PulL
LTIWELYSDFFVELGQIHDSWLGPEFSYSDSLLRRTLALAPPLLHEVYAMPRRSDVMLASDVAETQQGGVLDGIEQYSLPQSTVTRIAKAAVRIVALILASVTYSLIASSQRQTSKGKRTRFGERVNCIY